MKAKELMTEKVYTCRPEDTLDRVAAILWEQDCGVAPVVDGKNHVLGMVTDRDICMAALSRGQRLAEIPASVAMSRSVHTCKPSDSVAKVEETLRRNHVRRVPVVDGEKHLLGLLSLNDLAQEAARERKTKKRVITDAEVGATLAAVAEPRFHHGVIPPENALVAVDHPPA